METIHIGPHQIGEGSPFTLISGPCVIESEKHAMECAESLVNLLSKYPLQFIFKASYDKANRSSVHSFRGPGLEEGLKILEKIKRTFSVPVFTDVHSPEEAREAADVCDVIQIPAFLCRQTDLILAAGQTGAVVNIKKGQFMAPWDMKNVVDKFCSTGNKKLLLTDRGTSFGYNNLVSDMRAIPILQSLGFPTIYDATHSVQLPGGLGDKTGGESHYIPILSRAAIAAGCNAIYAESHPQPLIAKSDASSVIAFKDLPELVEQWLQLYEIVNPLCSKNL